MNRKLETQLYRWGCFFFLVVFSLTAIKRIFFPEFDIRDVMRPCAFYTLTGYYCPGCGGTRAVISLLHGRLLTAAVDFPMVIYCAAVYAWFMISHTIDRASRHRISIGMKYHPRWLYGSLVILAIHFIGKNVFFIATGRPPFL